MPTPRFRTLCTLLGTSLLTLAAPAIAAPVATPIAAPVAAGFAATVAAGRGVARDEAIDRAVERIAAESVRVVMLLRDFETAAAPTEDHRRFFEATFADRPAEFEAAVAGRRIDFKYAIEIHLARFAHGILRELLDSADPPRADELLALASEEHLESKRDFDGPVQREFGDQVDATIATPLAARWLLFAALREPRLFEGDGAIRQDEFISRLLLASESSAALAFLVRGALAPPFAVPWGKDGHAFPAGPFRQSRGKVGFTEDHAAIVRSLQEARSFEASVRERPPAIDPTAEPETDERAFLDEHLKILREWILDELDPSRTLAPIGSENRSADDVEREWRALAEQRSPAEYWSLAEPFFRSLIEGKAAHVHDARIAELEAKGEALTAQDRQELDALRAARTADRNRLLALLPELYAERAPVGDAFTTLLACDDALLRAGGGDLRDVVLAPAFAAASFRDAAYCADRLAEHLGEPGGGDLPPAARTAMIRSVATFAATTPGSAELLARCAREGSPVDRMHALTSIGIQPAAVADEMVRLAAEDCRALARDGAPNFELRAGLVASILARTKAASSAEDRARIAATWVETFERDGVNLWASGVPISSDLPESREDLRLLANSIPESDWIRLDLAGRLPENLKRFRDG